MSPPPPSLTFLVLSEDNNENALFTLTALVKKMLLLIDPHCGTHRARFEPANEEARKVMAGNAWRSDKPKDRPKNILLGRAIAAKLLEAEVQGFVIFHVDGDVPWSRRAETINLAKLDTFLQTFVMPALDRALRTQSAERGALPADEEIEKQAKAALGKLLRMVPYYCIEAWLYQNTAEAKRACARQCGKHIKVINEWEKDRDTLDELVKPKDKTCLGSEHNRVLAEKAFPADEVFRANTSFAASVMSWVECAELSRAMKATHA